MNTRRFANRFTLAFALLFTMSAASVRAANNAPAAAADGAEVAPLLEEQALLAVRADLSRIDPAAGADWAVGLLKDAGVEAQELEQMSGELRGGAAALGKWLDGLKSAGAERLYYVLSLEDVPPVNGPPGYLVVPLAEGADAKPLLDFFAGDAQTKSYGFGTDALGWRAAKVGDAVVVAGEARLARLKGLNGAPRPELAAALKAAGAGGGGDNAPAVVAAFIPSDDMRKALAETMPDLPPEAGAEPADTLTRGVTWASAAVTMPPNVSAKLVIRSADAEAAKSLAAWARRMLGVLAQQPELKQIVPNLAEVTRALEPKAKGEQVTVELTPQTVDRLLPVLAAGMREARGNAAAVRSSSNIRQLVVACFIYAEANKGAFPNDLAAALKAAGVDGAQVLVNPRQPQRGQKGYVYLKPAAGSAAGADAVVVYEAFDVWPPAGINVGYGDGHTELVREEAVFQKQLAKTRKMNEAKAKQGGAK